MSDLIGDVFSPDVFGVQTLTAAVNKLPHVPGQIGALGVFETAGVPTTGIVIDEYSGKVVLIPNTKRGGPSNVITSNRPKSRTLQIPHFPTRATILADEVRNVRAFGSTQLKSVEQLRDQRLADHIGSLDATVEYGRAGAIKGVIYDADGSTVIYNLFTEYGLTQDSTAFALTTASTKIRTKCMAVVRNIENALGASMYTGIVALCSDGFFDALVDHENVVATYQNWLAAADLRDDVRVRGFKFGNIVFINYRGSVTGSGGSAVKFIPDDEAIAFPVGVPGLFLTRFAPADYAETVNTMGLPRYAKAEPLKFNKGIEIEMQTNPLSLCTRPQVLQKLTKT
ncbi:MAG: major capsid protein [Rhodospirillaceae bacterium]